MKQHLLILLLLFGLGFANAQNLVPNNSFEQIDYCPSSNDYNFSLMQGWYNPNSNTPDPHNICVDRYSNDFFFSIPMNGISFQYPRTGFGHASFMIYNVTNNEREYISCALMDTLLVGHNYCFGMYVALAEEIYFNSSITFDSLIQIGYIPSNFQTSAIALKHIDAYFSNFPISSSTMDILSYPPQIQLKNNDETFLADTINWTLIQGSFVANGGEKHLTIGNFFTSANTETYSLALPGNENRSYYYFDDVFLFEPKPMQLKADTTKICAGDTIALHALGLALEYEWYDQNNPNEIIGRDTVLNVGPDSTTTYILKTRSCSTTEEKTVTIEVCEKTPQGTFLLYPNPASGFATLNYNFTHYDGKPVIELFDAAGRIVFSQQLNTANKSIDIPVYGLATAIYEVRVTDGKNKLWHGKLAVNNN